MRTNVLLVAVLVVSVLGPTSTPAQTPSPAPSPVPSASTLSEFARERVDTMLRTGHADAAWFSASFLAQIPATQVDTVLAQLKGALGDYKSIDGTHGDYTARFAKGTDEALVHLGADNKIDGLLFKPPKLQTSSLDEALRALQAPGATVSYVILEGRSQRAAFNASAPLAIGSAFKLAVLAAVCDETAAGRRHWDDVVPLDARWKSLPSGVLGTWPAGTPLTLATYAAEMISISDNTAADALVRLAGPAALGHYAARNVPFLTTREMFGLKSTRGATQAAAYITAHTSAEREKILRAVDAMPPAPPATLLARPLLDIEWHYSVRELCALMKRVADLPIMSINPGAADAAAFGRVAFKGGADAGVINLTTQVTTKRGTRICFSATLNDGTRAVDDSAFSIAYGAVLGTLANR